MLNLSFFMRVMLGVCHLGLGNVSAHPTPHVVVVRQPAIIAPAPTYVAPPTTYVAPPPPPTTVVIAPQPSDSGEQAFLACVEWAESNDDPTAYNASSGASGLYQFLGSTWTSTTGLSPPAGAYSVSTQTAAAELLYSQQGTAPWSGDGC